MRKLPVLFVSLLMVLLIASGFTRPEYADNPLSPEPPPKDFSTPWVDSVFTSLSLEQRIAQLIMIRVRTDMDEAYYDQMVREVKTHNVGGIAFFRGGPERQVLLTNRMQSQVQTPMLVAMDAEWGPSMRLDSTIVFPRQMALGAIQNDQYIYQMGMEIGRQLRRLGVHINFAPVVDVNNNPDNPVINFRAFGENRYNVANKGLAYMHGLQDAGVIACAKHFPGHGDTDADSHYTLPLLRHDFQEIDSIHLYPFRRMIEEGLHSVMVAHLEIPALEDERHLPSTLSKNMVTHLLQEDMGFKGLVITDALEMQGVSDHFSPGVSELKALQAGNDILLLPQDVPAAISAIINAVETGLISEELINERCRKVLYYKELVGLDQFTYIPSDRLYEDLNTTKGNLLNKSLAEASLTLVRNSKSLVPIRDLQHKKIAALSIGSPSGNHFQSVLGHYAPVSQFSISKDHSPEQASRTIRGLSNYDLVIISVHNNSFFLSQNYGINQQTIGLINTIAKETNVILALFANPYSLAFFEDDIMNMESILVAYQDGTHFEQAAAEAIFGGIQLNGKLPVSSGKYFPAGMGITTPAPGRIRFGKSEEVGIRSDLMADIDSLAQAGIRMGAYPGCQIAIIKDGVMIYNNSFGYHTYDSLLPVRNHHIYDLASITKVAATTTSIMRLKDEGRLDIDRQLGDYLPWLRGSDKEFIRLRDLLAHQARLTPWLPFYLDTMYDNLLIDGIYAGEQSTDFLNKVAGNMFIHNNYRDTIFHLITSSALLNKEEYRYSDLGFILLAEVVEQITGQNLQEFTTNFLLNPMGFNTMGFRPLDKFDQFLITPSEHDTVWRGQLIRGHVHDPAAAMLGGISGHAGLFSNASELAILMQMLLNGGHYGRQQYIDQITIEEFTRVQFPGNSNRRGLGFDKPSLKKNEPGPASESASAYSYGHSGFTGTLAWVDPVENLVFVFLSNRTFPSQDNRLLIEENIRTRIQQKIYDAIYHSRMLDNFTTSLIY